ncbi:HlyD family secretion protein [Mucilaginibacter psychrotolerans]|uniref:HlyD family efflux transporter periplasmic adaptor subunit n=1 Tax=Mucilaginibacter psychrotolerans TaxID=1524096 RepID=A0A4Y8SFA0_9SPHI|nr:HlyD family efflux transporter periplasmic adaptor subunit [Mucilaginibacter psychrotolerans]TFF37315.1 HlyD family efflux transporter periplasmic adaptor subunit [Mucilaginibacter psychrotolerans]
MPFTINQTADNQRHTDDMQDIITAVPSWILRWGITLFFCIIVLLISLSAFIKYPDIVKTQLKLSSPDVAKPVVPKITGRLMKLLVVNDEMVTAGQPLAYLESTADHKKVIALLAQLKTMQGQISAGTITAFVGFSVAGNGGLGELQASYQTFTQAYLTYTASVNNGFLLKKRVYLQKDMIGLKKQITQLEAEKALQQRDLNIAEEDYSMHKKLAQQRVETPAELRQQESKYLSRKAPLLQTDASLIAANTNYLNKQKEILELNNEVLEDKSKFLQALNSLISQAEDWKYKYILTASQAGKVSFAGTIQENQMVSPSQEVFYINSHNVHFFGEMNIPQNNLGKVKQGQAVLIKLKSYPFEEYGMLKGTISYINDVPFKDSIFTAKVVLKSHTASDLKKPVQIKQGMMADAEIITEDATLLQRLTRNVIKAMNSN